MVSFFLLGTLCFVVVGVVANEEIWQLASVVLALRHNTLVNGWFALWWERGEIGKMKFAHHSPVCALSP